MDNKQDLTTEKIFKALRAFGMIQTLADHVTEMRRMANQNWDIPPVARKTVYIAFTTDEKDRTPLHELIITEGTKLVKRVPAFQ